MNDVRISQALSVTLHDYHPRTAEMREEILDGLRAQQKTLPCKYFYDDRGSRLFDVICELPEYYLTRTELGIMEVSATDMAASLGARVRLVEPGSGSSLKTRLLLDHLVRPSAYVPVDISRAHLVTTADCLNQVYPELEVLPVCADFSQSFAIPAPRRTAQRTVIYFPGSTIGNFEPAAAMELLKRLRRLAGPNGALLIGVDLRKDEAVLQRAYSDTAGVTAEFNLNILRRINRELHADFNLNGFRHRAVYNSAAGRIEMHLVSCDNQLVRLAGDSFSFLEDEAIVTEYSYKHTLAGFKVLAAKAGLQVEKVWTDDRRWFSVQYLTAA